MNMQNKAVRMPAEWEPHDATWIAWPHNTKDWPGKFQPIPWVYAEIVRVLSESECVNILCHSRDAAAQAERMLGKNGVRRGAYSLHNVPNDRCWVRDSGPTGVIAPNGSVGWVQWMFNAWAKYDNFHFDRCVAPLIARCSGLPITTALHGDQGTEKMVVLEGGGIDTNGEGRLLVTEEWLLSDTQVRNPGFTKEDYEEVFARYLGITETIWLGRGCEGDDTHGRVDDIARFESRNVVALALEHDPLSPNYEPSMDNHERLKRHGIEVVHLPYPRRIVFDGQVVPASYANFYIGNSVVLVPTFNDPNDREALNIMVELFPDREVVGINCSDLIWGLGTLHCLTQQQPAAQ